jgi:hypothetical protein
MAEFRTPKNLGLLRILWIILAGLPLTASASLYEPPSYAIISADNKTMLVMCSPIKTNWDSGYIFTLPSGQQINLREKFKTNGVYRLDNFQCVQPLDWFADQSELFNYGDFNILVRLNQFAVDSQDKTNWSWCLRFYKQGKVVKEYQVKDLVGIPSYLFLPETSYGWHTVWYELAAFTGGAGMYPLSGSYYSQWQFVLVTEPQFFGPWTKLSNGNVYVFDVFTGEIVQQWRHHPLVKCLIDVILFLALYFLALVCCVKIYRKLFRKLRPKKRGETTKSLPFWVRRFFAAILSIFGLFMFLILFTDWSSPRPFDDLSSTVLFLAWWPSAASGFAWGEYHPVIAILTGTLAAGLFWAAFTELFFKWKDRNNKGAVPGIV